MRAFAIFTLVTACVAGSSHADSGWSVREEFRPGGDTGWDYLSYDAATKRLFVSRATHVQVLDGDNGKTVGDIPDTPGVHGIALVPDAHKGFTSNGKSNTVTVFNLDTLQVLRQITVEGKKPDAIIYDTGSGHVLAFNGGSDSYTAIDPIGESAIATVPLPGRPEFGAADGQGHVFVNLEDKGAVSEIDSLNNKVLGTWSLGSCTEPSGLAYDAAHHRIFSTCQNRKLVVLDSTSGKQVAELPIGLDPDAAAFDASAGLVFSSNGAGTLTVIKEDDADHFHVVADVRTKKSARSMALDPVNHRIFLPAAAAGGGSQGKSGLVPGSFRIIVVRDGS